MGFETLMLAPWAQRARLEALLDHLAQLTVETIEGLAELGGVDAFMTWQDYGTQTQLVVSLDMFRELYAPRLASVVRAAHEAGMDFIWHCCGQIFDLIPEMIAMGVDVVQLDQPRLLGHARLAEEFGGRICFWNAVDTQWATGDHLSDADLRAEVAAMTTPFRHFGGGLMARHYPQPHDIGLSPHFHDVTARAFLDTGRHGGSP
jgi:uroporphyrinogen-III decarboxylase